MVRLTEEMIVARTRVSDMSNVKKLNCWGAELTDVTVLRKLVNVEVLSLSVNCITTLADIQNCKNLQELYIRKNKIPDLSEVCWLRDLTKLKNLWLEENPCCNTAQSDLYRATVIRNLPQLQKLDNVVVQPDEVAESMRRGIELIHPYDQDESIPYTNYAPPGPPSYQQQPAQQPPPQQPPISSGSGNSTSRRSSQIVEQTPYNFEDHHSRRNSQYDQYSCPSRRVSNQVFDPPFGHHHGSTTPPTHPASSSADADVSAAAAAQAAYGQMVRAGSVNYGMPDDGYVPDYHTGRRFSSQYEQAAASGASPQSTSTRRSSKVSQHSMSMTPDESLRRMSIHETASGNFEDERNANNYNSRAHSVQPQDPYDQQHLPRNAYARSNSEPTKVKKHLSNSRKANSLTTGKSPPPIKEHPTPTEEDISDQLSSSCKNCSSGRSQDSEDESNFRSLQLMENGRQSQQQQAKLCPSATNDHTNKKCMNCNGGTSSPASCSSASTTSTSKMSLEDPGDPRSMVASHYEHTYEQVDLQIASAKQLVEERRMRSQVSPERPYPRRPKNRNSNILSAVLCLIKELDAPSLEVAEMAIRCRMEELDD